MQRKLCVKCPSYGVVVLNHKDVYCKECFTHYVTHRFRATLGKRKVFRKDEKVLIACSGGSASSALVDLVSSSVNPTDDKRLKVTPSILRLVEDLNFKNDNIRAGPITKYTAFLPCVIYEEDFEIYDAQGWLEAVNSARFILFQAKFQALLSCVNTDTSRLDLIRHLKMAALYKCAKKLEFDFLMLGDSSTQLAHRTLTDVALGRGDQMALGSGLLDKRPAIALTVVRPLRDLDAKALALYNYFRNIQYDQHEPHIIQHSRLSAIPTSIQSETSSFVDSLAQSFPATVSTLLSSATKLCFASSASSLDSCSSSLARDQLCKLCGSYILRSDIFTLSAFDGSKKDFYCYGCNGIVNDLSDLSLLPSFVG